MVEVAAVAGVPVETLRKIEAGRVPTPAFFTIVALAGALEIPVDSLALGCTSGSGTDATPLTA
jgi:transcriptional regulator with XRE-family HTH domain